MIVAQDIKFFYNLHASSFVLKCNSFQACQAEITCIVGSNGSGKTTFLRLLNGELRPQEGSILIDERNVANLSKSELLETTGWIDAGSTQFLVDELLVVDHLAMALKISKQELPIIHRELDCRNLQERSSLGVELSSQIEKIMYKRIANLSAGQKQTVAIVLAVLASMNKRNIILTDEGTAHLDVRNAELFFTTISRIASERKISCLVVTHDLLLGTKYADKTYILDAGEVSKVNFDPNDDLETRINILKSFFT